MVLRAARTCRRLRSASVHRKALLSMDTPGMAAGCDGSRIAGSPSTESITKAGPKWGRAWRPMMRTQRCADPFGAGQSAGFR